MTEATEQNIRTFQVGDVLRIEAEIIDDTGVAGISIRFRNEHPNVAKTVLKTVKLSGEKHIKETLEIPIDEEFSTGEYTCEYVSFEDTLGNSSIETNVDIRFYVENERRDSVGPEMKKLALA